MNLNTLPDAQILTAMVGEGNPTPTRCHIFTTKPSRLVLNTAKWPNEFDFLSHYNSRVAWTLNSLGMIVNFIFIFSFWKLSTQVDN